MTYTKHSRKIFAIVGMLCFLLTFQNILFAQTATSVQCGDIVEAEFVRRGEVHNYQIQLSPGDQLEVSVRPIGEALLTAITLLGPTREEVLRDPPEGATSQPTLSSPILSARGVYIVEIANDGSPGVYTFYIGCSLRDGSMISPGDVQPTSATSEPNANAGFSGYGFPGLSPVDFADSVIIPLEIDRPSRGAITPGFQSVFGFSFNASAGDVVNLSFERISGNLNLGLVMLREGNQVVFQSSLILSRNLTTQIEFSENDEYILGVFRVDLVPPENPEITAFELLIQSADED